MRAGGHAPIERQPDVVDRTRLEHYVHAAARHRCPHQRQAVVPGIPGVKIDTKLWVGRVRAHRQPHLVGVIEAEMLLVEAAGDLELGRGQHDVAHAHVAGDEPGETVPDASGA